MNVVELEVGTVKVIQLKGRMDSDTSTGVEPVLLERAASCKALVVDLQNVQYVSSAGLRVLLKTAKTCRANNNKLALAALLPQVHEVFDISGFAAIFQIFDDADKAASEIS
jgi:anti-sigma B factor antagonist